MKPCRKRTRLIHQHLRTADLNHHAAISVALLLFAVFFMTAISGCGPQEEQHAIIKTKSVNENLPLEKALNTVLSTSRYNTLVANEDVENNLNIWIEKIDTDNDWKPTPLISTLP